MLILEQHNFLKLSGNIPLHWFPKHLILLDLLVASFLLSLVQLPSQRRCLWVSLQLFTKESNISSLFILVSTFKICFWQFTILSQIWSWILVSHSFNRIEWDLENHFSLRKMGKWFVFPPLQSISQCWEETLPSIALSLLLQGGCRLLSPVSSRQLLFSLTVLSV